MRPIAQTFNNKGKTITVSFRADPTDIQHLKERAAAAGIKYQTLLSIILHQFRTKKLKIEI